MAVGFVDLSFLMQAELDDTQKGPLLFVGYERSAFAVAKTLVIWKMLECGAASTTPRSVLQVWYSSTWEKATLAEFKTAMHQVLQGPDFAKVGMNVKELIRHWAECSVEISVASTREKWMALGAGDMRSYIGHFLRRCDRIDMARYELTGEIGLRCPKSAHCGSITLFDCPRGTPKSAENETVFEAVDMR